MSADGWFHFGNRKKAYALLKKLTKDMEIFSNDFDNLLKKHQSLTLSELKADSRLVHELVRIDLSLVTVFKQLYRKHRLHFNEGGQKEQYLELLELFEQLREDLHKSSEDIKKLLRDARQNFDFSEIPHKVLLHELQDLEDNENHAITTIKTVETFIDIHPAKCERIGTGKFYIDMDDRMLYIYQDDFHVGEIEYYMSRGALCVGFTSLARVSHAGFIEKTIVLMLESGKITAWESKGGKSPHAFRLYERLKKNSKLKVEQIWEGIRVTLK